MDANKTTGEEARWQLHKECCVQSWTNPGSKHPTRHQPVRPPAPYQENYSQLDEPDMQDTCWTKQRWTHKRCTLMDPHTWPRKSRTTQLERTFSSYGEDTGCCPEDLPRAMNDREEWRERVRDICATSAIWWWWWCCCLLKREI